MLGTIIGDMAGSIYEWHPCKDKGRLKSLPLLGDEVFFTDDTVMTIAVAYALLFGETTVADSLGKDGFDNQALATDLTDRRRNPDALAKAVVAAMQHFGQNYPGRGYGGRFAEWLWESNPQPYNSYGNGSAMRVSPVAWFFDNLKDVEKYAQITAEVTHSHPEGIKGARATAAAIYMARTGASKQEIRTYIEDTYGYDLSRTVDEIRPDYSFDVTCQGSVPEAIIAFLDSTSFENAIINAISLGGDADTQAAITASIAEAFYGVPEALKQRALELLDDNTGAFLEIWDLEVLDKIDILADKPNENNGGSIMDTDRLDFLISAFFGFDSNPYPSSSSRAYRDLCRTLRLGKIGHSMRRSLRLKVDDLLEERIKILLDEGVFSQDDYDKWHQELSKEIKSIYDNQNVDLTYGHAQKWINMTMKYLYIHGGVNLASIFEYLHVPVDSYVYSAAKKELGIEPPCNPWSKISKYEAYLGHQKAIREALIKKEPTMPPLRWEFSAWIREAKSKTAEAKIEVSKTDKKTHPKTTKSDNATKYQNRMVDICTALLVEGKMYSRKNIVDIVQGNDAPENRIGRGSILPSDFCYNRVNDGIIKKFEKLRHIFEYHDRDEYIYRGENYPFIGDIYQKPQKGKVEIKVGKWLESGKIKWFDL